MVRNIKLVIIQKSTKNLKSNKADICFFLSPVDQFLISVKEDADFVFSFKSFESCELLWSETERRSLQLELEIKNAYEVWVLDFSNDAEV